MKKDLLKVGIRHGAIFLSSESMVGNKTEMKNPTMQFVAALKTCGFSVSEELLWAINSVNPNYQLLILETFKDVLGLNKNWTPLVKGWDDPTGESHIDHLITYFANFFQSKKGTTLDCGHIIPEGTFPLERYNGCPFCGTPFTLSKETFKGQGSKLKILELWTDQKMLNIYQDLLESKTALDETQKDTLKIVMKYYPLPEATIQMKETLMLAMENFIANDELEKAQRLVSTPTDILRFLWYKKTGFVQIIEPKTIVKRKARNNKHIVDGLSKNHQAAISTIQDLKLKYTRKECSMFAKWLNDLEMDVNEIAAQMHPKRGMWVRFIRALRLSEYSKRKGMDKLNMVMDIFYNQKYVVWAGKVNSYRLKSDALETFRLLKQRPGLFARSLFSNMLWFGSDSALAAFSEVADKVPARLIFTLNMYAKNYFEKDGFRTVKPLGGINKKVKNNPLLNLYDTENLEKMKSGIEDLCLDIVLNRFATQKSDSQTIYIDPMLFNIPLSIGDRSETVQDLPSALMGTRFPLEGTEIRLFMQWGEGMPAQHLDMDLSCHLAYENGKNEVCSYYNLVTNGCKHSGDIRSIPNKVGTAEYINIDIKQLIANKVKYVTFTCNAYSNGSISPNLVVGWMDSKFPMKISETTGVAYDPSCVIHQLRVTQSLLKGLVFGVLDVDNQSVVWLEMSFQGQNIATLDTKGVEALLAKLNSKLSVGNLLNLKAQAQNLTIVDTIDADEVYDLKWASNPATVTKLFVD